MLRSLSAQEIYPDDADAKYYTSGMLRTEQTFSLIYGNREHEVDDFSVRIDLLLGNLLKLLASGREKITFGGIILVELHLTKIKAGVADVKDHRNCKDRI